MSTDAPAHETASLLDHFRKLNGALPSNLCRHRLLDLNFLEHDLADPQSFINKKLSEEERDFVRWERQMLVAKCIGGKKSHVPYLYKFNDTGAEAFKNTLRVILEDNRDLLRELPMKR